MQKTRCALAVGLAMVAGVAWAAVPQVSPEVQKATETAPEKNLISRQDKKAYSRRADSGARHHCHTQGRHTGIIAKHTVHGLGTILSRCAARDGL